MINFWHKNLHEYDDQGAAVMKLPAAAKIQLGERGVYPWAKECKDQITEMGPRALGHPDWYKAKAAALWKNVGQLVAHNVPAIPFKARRQPQKRLVEHSMDD